MGRNLQFLVVPFVLLGLGVGNPAVAANSSSPNLLKDLAQNASLTFSRYQTVDMVALLAIVPTLADGETNRVYRVWTTQRAADQVFEYGDALGNGALQAGAALLAYTGGKLFHKTQLAALGSDLFSAQVIAGTLSTGLKVVTNRTRPDGTRYSFPSGHSTAAFATAGVIANRYGVWPGIIAEAAATYVGLSRLQENKHYISDVAAGCLLGNYIAYQVVHSHGAFRNVSVLAGGVPDAFGAAVEFRLR
jgi:membrane-associated phospholipid phosphatase